MRPSSVVRLASVGVCCVVGAVLTVSCAREVAVTASDTPWPPVDIGALHNEALREIWAKRGSGAAFCDVLGEALEPSVERIDVRNGVSQACYSEPQREPGVLMSTAGTSLSIDEAVQSLSPDGRRVWSDLVLAMEGANSLQELHQDVDRLRARVKFLPDSLEQASLHAALAVADSSGAFWYHETAGRIPPDTTPTEDLPDRHVVTDTVSGPAVATGPAFMNAGGCPTWSWKKGLKTDVGGALIGGIIGAIVSKSAGGALAGALIGGITKSGEYAWDSCFVER